VCAHRSGTVKGSSLATAGQIVHLLPEELVARFECVFPPDIKRKDTVRLATTPADSGSTSLRGKSFLLEFEFHLNCHIGVRIIRVFGWLRIGNCNCPGVRFECVFPPDIKRKDTVRLGTTPADSGSTSLRGKSFLLELEFHFNCHIGVRLIRVIGWLGIGNYNCPGVRLI
jgi:hypothetical protein